MSGWIQATMQQNTIVAKKGVITYNVGRKLFKVWTANSDMKKLLMVRSLKVQIIILDNSCW